MTLNTRHDLDDITHAFNLVSAGTGGVVEIRALKVGDRPWSITKIGPLVGFGEDVEVVMGGTSRVAGAREHYLAAVERARAGHFARLALKSAVARRKGGAR